MATDRSDRVSVRAKNMKYEGWSRIVEYDFSYRTGNGDVIERSWEVCERPNASAVLVFDRDKGKFIFVRQLRVPVYAMGEGDGFLIEAAAGLIDKGETPEQAARREAREETGYDVHDIRLVSGMLSAPGLMTEKVFCYVAVAGSSMRVTEGGGLAAEHEDIELLELTFDEATAMVETGEICDAKTVILIQWAALNRSFFGL